MLKTTKDIHYVQTDFSNIVSTLHDKQGLNPQRADKFTHRKIVRGGQLEKTNGVVLKSVNAQRHHQVLC